MAGIIDGRQIVTTAGTRVQLSSTSVAINSVMIAAETDNTSDVTVGGPTVVGALATRRGVPLPAGAVVTFDSRSGVDELSDVWLDAITSGDGVTYLYTPAS